MTDEDLPSMESGTQISSSQMGAVRPGRSSPSSCACARVSLAL
eukprot:CAMPEP_0171065360 /NCGR_PEP_ID=MMETSP0766_2-20121228/6796_1 /TAXON_ID=439317 /ORGANISM="Gambierdiscus australes, Strain CAWD 149" /LENGTH=42 /DNA_ID= /DNA_START= /DNA_END= /DNA_ORIENTATION=